MHILRSSRAVIALALMLLLILMVAATSLAATGDPVLLNEVVASHTGTDNTEFIELYGTPGTSLDGLSLIVVESDNITSLGAIDRRIDFGPTDALGSNGFYLIGNPVGLGINYGVTPNYTISDNYLENSSMTVALVETSSLSGSSVTGAEVVKDTVGLTDGGAGDTFFFGAPVIGPDGTFFPAGARRVVDGVDTDAAADWVISDFNLGSANTPTAAPSGGGGGASVVVNEILASHTGTDDTEFIELYGTPDEVLDGLSLIVVESDNITSLGAIDRRIDFTAADTLGPNGFYLIGNPVGLLAHYGVAPDIEIATNYLENNSMTVALVETSSLSGSSVGGGEVVIDTVALNDGGAGDTFFFGAPVIGPDGTFFPAGARRVVDGVDTDTAADWVISDFGLGAANTPTAGHATPPPPPPVVTIMEIQGSSQFSVYDDMLVETSGVVTLFTANGANFWLQDASGDGDAATSDGIFVAGGGFPAEGPRPAVGDQIRIIARVDEQQFAPALPLTRLTSVALIEVQSSGNPLPAPVALTDLPNTSIPDGIAFWEPLEGMLVSIENGFVVGPTNGFGEFVMLTETDADADLGSGFYAQTQQILISSIGPNDVDYNPERIMVDDSTLNDAIIVRPGDRVKSLVGAVDFTFGNYKIQPASYDLKTHNLPNGQVSSRSGAPGSTTITTFNVENLFDLVDEPTKDDESSTPTADQLETKLNKLALAIEDELELPAIIVVQEVENTAILQTLGDRVNASAGTNYVATSFETSDGRGIEVGFLWDANRVDLLNAFQMSGPDVEAAFGPSSASPGREPLVGEFDINGYTVTIIGNHFKSKGGDDALFSVNWPPVRSTEVQRKAQAQVVRDFVNGILDGDPGALVMVTGDLNDFQFGEPGEGSDHPVAILEGTGSEVPLTDLIYDEKPAEMYSYVFDGNSQVLDHMLVSPALYDMVAAVDILHFNAGFEDVLTEDDSTAIRSSDHDPIEGRFNFN